MKTAQITLLVIMLLCMAWGLVTVQRIVEANKLRLEYITWNMSSSVVGGNSTYEISGSVK